MPEIVISEFMDLESVNATAKKFKVQYNPELVDRPADLKKYLHNARALVVRNRTQVNADLLSAAPNLQVIGRLGVGLDNIDLAECKKREITVCPATGANDAAVAEWVICSAMMLLRGAFQSHSQMLAGEWPRQKSIGKETAGKTLGLIGFGGIARHTASLARPLGLRIAAFDPYLSKDDSNWADTDRHETLGDLFQQSDLISLHVPLTEETYHLVDAQAISTMREGAIVINAARGGVVDEKALVDALKSGKLGGGALDVFENEPLTGEAASLFEGTPNLILTPHIGGVTVESNVRVSKVTMQNVCNVLEASK